MTAVSTSFLYSFSPSGHHCSSEAEFALEGPELRRPSG